MVEILQYLVLCIILLLVMVLLAVNTIVKESECGEEEMVESRRGKLCIDKEGGIEYLEEKGRKSEED